MQFINASEGLHVSHKGKKALKMNNLLVYLYLYCCNCGTRTVLEGFFIFKGQYLPSKQVLRAVMSVCFPFFNTSIENLNIINSYVLANTKLAVNNVQFNYNYHL